MRASSTVAPNDHGTAEQGYERRKRRPIHRGRVNAYQLHPARMEHPERLELPTRWFVARCGRWVKGC